jgi:hypothetical protein
VLTPNQPIRLLKKNIHYRYNRHFLTEYLGIKKNRLNWTNAAYNNYFLFYPQIDADCRRWGAFVGLVVNGGVYPALVP